VLKKILVTGYQYVLKFIEYLAWLKIFFGFSFAGTCIINYILN